MSFWTSFIDHFVSFWGKLPTLLLSWQVVKVNLQFMHNNLRVNTSHVCVGLGKAIMVFS